MRQYIGYGFFCMTKVLSFLIGTIFSNIKLFIAGASCCGFVKAFGGLRVCIYPHARISIGRRCCFRSSRCSNVAGILHPCFISAIGQGNLTIGDGCGFSGTIIVAENSITIGADVLFGANTFVYDTDCHPVDAAARINWDRGKRAAVVIKDRVWLGANVMVLKGVTIGENSVIAANSVVTSDIPPNVIAGGCPAKIIKQLTIE